MDDRQTKTDSLLPAAERQRVLVEWNATAADYPRDRSIQAWFEQQVERTPTNVALHFMGDSLTYQQVNQRANQWAHYLLSQGVQTDTPIAICLEPGFDLLIGILAILKAGGGYVPLDPHYPHERLQFMLADTQAPVLLTQSAFVSIFGNVETKKVCMDEEVITTFPETNPAQRNQPNDLAYVIYTSGSTGKPKGVMITQRNVSHFLHWFGEALTIDHRDVVDFSSSISFDFSVPNTLFPLTRGASIAICPENSRKDSYLYLTHLEESKVSVIKITPSHFRQLKEFITPAHTLSHLRWIIFGGEASYVKDIQSWLMQFPHHTIFNEYGPTEATVATSWIIIDKDNLSSFKHLLPIGKPSLNSQLYILNSDLQPVAPGALGELYIGGEGVARGYLNRPEVTAERFIRNPFSDDPSARLYKTGDICRFLENGNIEFIERVDHQVKIRGFRIEIAEIEMNLVSHPAIKEVVVTAPEALIDQTGEKRLVAYCVAQSKKTLPDAQVLREHLQHSLPEYMIPAVFVMLDALPISPNGKLDRKALPLPTLTGSLSYVPPSNELEQSLARIWAEVLNLKDVGIHDDFFELGGHSLTAARIISKIAKQHHKVIKLHAFYQTPTIEALAKIVEQADDYHQDTVSERAATTKGLPLSDMQMLFWLSQKSYTKSQALNIVDRRRVSGKLQTKTLQEALQYVLQRHAVLSSRISRFSPMQYTQSPRKAQVQVMALQRLTPAEREQQLMQSMDELRHYSFTQKGEALIIVRLFHLDDQYSEVQVAMSHIISDELSPEIVFNDLSTHYTGQPLLDAAPSYYEYATFEREHFNHSLADDIAFWNTYLKNVALFNFQSVQQPKSIKSYSTYIEMSDALIKRLRAYCAKHRLSLSDSLCAAVGMALRPYAELKQHLPVPSIVINMVKSTRDNDRYDETVGFFVRADLIKMVVHDVPDFLTLSKRVQQSSIETESHQSCPVIVKLANLFQIRWRNKRVRKALLSLMAQCVSHLFPRYQLHPDILNHYGNMFLANSKRNCLVQVNVLNNFVHDRKPTSLFGYKTENVDGLQSERLVSDHVLEVSFDRNNQNRPYLIVAGKLPPALREQIGKAILQAIDECDHAGKMKTGMAYP